MNLIARLNIKSMGFMLLIGPQLFLQGCSTQWGAQIQWNSADQILMSEDSQVKLRSLQTRVIDTQNKADLMRQIVATMQDLFFDIDVLDEELGIISGKKLYRSSDGWANDPTYAYYKTDNLIIFSRNFRTYGPFQYRNDLIRLSVTLRPRGDKQYLVRASIQYNLRSVEDPELYQAFFKTFEQSRFLSREVK